MLVVGMIVDGAEAMVMCESLEQANDLQTQIINLMITGSDEDEVRIKMADKPVIKKSNIITPGGM